MSTRGTPPQPAPDFTHTAESIISATKKLIDRSKLLEDSIAKEITKETATFNNVLQPLANEESDMSLEAHILGFYQYVSADKALRDASSEAEKLMDEYGIESGMRQDIFDLVDAIYKNPALHPEVPEAAWYLKKAHQSYIKNGMSLPEGSEERALFKKIKKELSELGIRFSKTLNEENGGIWFTKEELVGVPEDVISTLKVGEGENEGKIFLTYKYPDLLPTMKYCTNPETRRRLFLGNENKCDSNEKVFKDAVVLRDEKARLLGFDSHSDFVLSERMAKSKQKVQEFLGDLRQKLIPGGETEKAKLLELKKTKEPDSDHYYLWDHRFYDNLMLEKDYALDAQKIAEYFPLMNTIEKMFGIFEQLFGLEFFQVTDKKELEGKIWHDDCKLFQVWNKGYEGDDGFVGWLYLDLHPRDGKYGHAANFNLQPGFIDRHGKRRVPATALVCNFSKPTKDKPSLLKHDEVVTLFHELGHGIHDLVSRTIYSRFHGTSVVRDFVEAPSQMLENWCWQPEQLKYLSSHYTSKEALPEELIGSLVRTRHVNDALANLRQLHFGYFDLRVHGPSSHKEIVEMDPTVEYNELRTQITLLDPPADTDNKFGKGQTTFGHLMGGYDSGYYGYLWSQVFSTDMFYQAFKKDPMNPEAGRRYRKLVLERGGSQDEMESLKEFLGREPNADAFLEELGLKNN
ncbi:zincin [Ascobolus immersus RN42]|uniref:Zincin n=1 Tax=Ascobolus immersus RN42 TaxID=1160509 RepID=A0A3N4HKN7_ASCIM|nr:zincin [Ascobolus immersus RN42]